MCNLIWFTSNRSSEIPCRVSELPGAEVILLNDPLITAKPSPGASIKDEAVIGG
jgi:hypothetical protein